MVIRKPNSPITKPKLKDNSPLLVNQITPSIEPSIDLIVWTSTLLVAKEQHSPNQVRIFLPNSIVQVIGIVGTPRKPWPSKI